MKASIMKYLMQKGFTLIELMIAISIIGILAAIALTTYLNYVNKTRISTCHSEAASFVKERSIAINLSTETTILPSYTPASCSSATDTSPVSISPLTNDAIFIAKDTTGTAVTCVWSTLSCTTP